MEIMELERKTAYRPDPNELERLKKQEFDRRRKLRLQQVREHSKHLAARLRTRCHRQREKEVKKLAWKIQEEMDATEDTELGELEARYRECLERMGEGHNKAKEWKDPSIEKSLKAEDNARVADDRFRLAVDILRDLRDEESSVDRERERCRQLALDTERERAKMVAALPPPPPDPLNMEPQVTPRAPVTIFNQSAISTSHVQANQMYVVEKNRVEEGEEGDGDTPDAKKVANERTARWEEAERRKEVQKTEDRVKAEVRGKTAMKKENVRQTYEKMVGELASLHRGDLCRRQKGYNNIPKQIFAVPVRLEEEARAAERGRERAFETAVISAADGMTNKLVETMRLIGPFNDVESANQKPEVEQDGNALRSYKLHSDHHQQPTRDDIPRTLSADSRPRISTTEEYRSIPEADPKKELAISQQIGFEPKEIDIDRLPLKERGLYRLFDRIKEQRQSWMERGGGEDISPRSVDELGKEDRAPQEKEKDGEQPKPHIVKVAEADRKPGQRNPLVSLDNVTRLRRAHHQSSNGEGVEDVTRHSRQVDHLLSEAEFQREKQTLEEEAIELDKRIRSIRFRALEPLGVRGIDIAMGRDRSKGPTDSTNEMDRAPVKSSFPIGRDKEIEEKERERREEMVKEEKRQLLLECNNYDHRKRDFDIRANGLPTSNGFDDISQERNYERIHEPRVPQFNLISSEKDKKDAYIEQPIKDSKHSPCPKHGHQYEVPDEGKGDRKHHENEWEPEREHEIDLDATLEANSDDERRSVYSQVSTASTVSLARVREFQRQALARMQHQTLSPHDVTKDKHERYDVTKDTYHQHERYDVTRLIERHQHDRYDVTGLAERHQHDHYGVTGLAERHQHERYDVTKSGLDKRHKYELHEDNYKSKLAEHHRHGPNDDVIKKKLEERQRHLYDDVTKIKFEEFQYQEKLKNLEEAREALWMDEDKSRVVQEKEERRQQLRVKMALESKEEEMARMRLDSYRSSNQIESQRITTQTIKCPTYRLHSPTIESNAPPVIDIESNASKSGRSQTKESGSKSVRGSRKHKKRSLSRLSHDSHLGIKRDPLRVISRKPSDEEVTTTSNASWSDDVVDTDKEIDETEYDSSKRGVSPPAHDRSKPPTTSSDVTSLSFNVTASPHSSFLHPTTSTTEATRSTTVTTAPEPASVEGTPWIQRMTEVMGPLIENSKTPDNSRMLQTSSSYSNAGLISASILGGIRFGQDALMVSPPPEVHIAPEELSFGSFVSDERSLATIGETDEDQSTPNSSFGKVLTDNTISFTKGQDGPPHPRNSKPPVSNRFPLASGDTLGASFYPHELSLIQESASQNASVLAPPNSSTMLQTTPAPLASGDCPQTSGRVQEGASFYSSKNGHVTKGSLDVSVPRTGQSGGSRGDCLEHTTTREDSSNGMTSGEADQDVTLQKCRDVPTTPCSDAAPYCSSPRDSEGRQGISAPPPLVAPPLSSISSGEGSSNISWIKTDLMTKYFQANAGKLSALQTTTPCRDQSLSSSSPGERTLRLSSHDFSSPSQFTNSSNTNSSPASFHPMEPHQSNDITQKEEPTFPHPAQSPSLSQHPMSVHSFASSKNPSSDVTASQKTCDVTQYTASQSFSRKTAEITQHTATSQSFSKKTADISQYTASQSLPAGASCKDTADMTQFLDTQSTSTLDSKRTVNVTQFPASVTSKTSSSITQYTADTRDLIDRQSNLPESFQISQYPTGNTSLVNGRGDIYSSTNERRAADESSIENHRHEEKSREYEMNKWTSMFKDSKSSLGQAHSMGELVSGILSEPDLSLVPAFSQQSLPTNSSLRLSLNSHHIFSGSEEWKAVSGTDSSICQDPIDVTMSTPESDLQRAFLQAKPHLVQRYQEHESMRRGQPINSRSLINPIGMTSLNDVTDTSLAHEDMISMSNKYRTDSEKSAIDSKQSQKSATLKPPSRPYSNLSKTSSNPRPESNASSSTNQRPTSTTSSKSSTNQRPVSNASSKSSTNQRPISNASAKSFTTQSTNKKRAPSMVDSESEALKKTLLEWRKERHQRHLNSNVTGSIIPANDIEESGIVPALDLGSLCGGSTSEGSTNRAPLSEDTVTSEDRKKSRKETLERTNRLWNRLDEVKKRKEQEERELKNKLNREKAMNYSKKTRKEFQKKAD